MWASKETDIGKIKNIIDQGTASYGVVSKHVEKIAEQEVTQDIDFMDGESHQMII